MLPSGVMMSSLGLRPHDNIASLCNITDDTRLPVHRLLHVAHKHTHICTFVHRMPHACQGLITSLLLYRMQGVLLYLHVLNKSFNLQELLGIAYNRLILMDVNTMEQKKNWRYSAMKSWNVNWESKQLRVDHEEEKLLFQCLSADLKIVHEFIGGNIWLSLRNDKDPLDLSMFVKLTGGVTNNLSGWGSETMARFLAA